MLLYSEKLSAKEFTALIIASADSSVNANFAIPALRLLDAPPDEDITNSFTNSFSLSQGRAKIFTYKFTFKF